MREREAAMKYLFGEVEIRSETGYIENEEETIPEIFPVQRSITMKTYVYGRHCYFRTRDVAALLGIKQPFQFTSDCKEILGESSIKKGEDTASFRLEEDNNKVTFIEAADLQIVLSDEKIKEQCIPSIYTQVKEALQSIVKFQTRKPTM